MQKADYRRIGRTGFAVERGDTRHCASTVFDLRMRGTCHVVLQPDSLYRHASASEIPPPALAVTVAGQGCRSC